MATDPRVAIQERYSDVVHDALDAHERGVKKLNEKLANDLEKADTDKRRNELLDTFNETVAPVQAAYHDAVAKAELERDEALAAL